LIYLNTDIQKRVLNLFHFALAPNGILFLGSSESLGELNSLFHTLDSKWKIFDYKGGSQMLAFQSFKPHNIPPHSDLIKFDTRMQETISPHDFSNELQEKIIHQYLPPAIIINEDLEILQVINDVNNYLKIPVGKIINQVP
jgi:two-component system CheB/CheR fusion protein